MVYDDHIRNGAEGGRAFHFSLAPDSGPTGFGV